MNRALIFNATPPPPTQSTDLPLPDILTVTRPQNPPPSITISATFLPNLADPGSPHKNPSLPLNPEIRHHQPFSPQSCPFRATTPAALPTTPQITSKHPLNPTQLGPYHPTLARHQQRP
ncbi:hypothetical protein PtB15_8B94 [Puccinia triticina]|nr:hypothetical protein PtB15_8B94 [Puccinia triticina]